MGVLEPLQFIENVFSGEMGSQLDGGFRHLVKGENSHGETFLNSFLMDKKWRMYLEITRRQKFDQIFGKLAFFEEFLLHGGCINCDDDFNRVCVTLWSRIFESLVNKVTHSFLIAESSSFPSIGALPQ